MVVGRMLAAVPPLAVRAVVEQAPVEVPVATAPTGLAGVLVEVATLMTVLPQLGPWAEGVAAAWSSFASLIVRL